MQAVFSSLFYFAPIALFQGFILVGYTTIYTMAPVFSLVYDQDISEETAMDFPELYKELTKGRTLSYKTFFIWLFVSVYQGGIIMLLAIWLFEDEFLRIVSISFTSLIFNELFMVVMEITTWHLYMVVAQILTVGVYLGSMWLLPTYFDLAFIGKFGFFWRVALIVTASSLPVFIFTQIKSILYPSSHSKLRVP